MADTTKPEIAQLLRRINEGATNSQTPLGEVMRLCLRLGRLLNNKELSEWAKAEAGGYESTDSLPDYRIFKTEVRGTFSGLLAVVLAMCLFLKPLLRKSTGTRCSQSI